MASTGGDPCSAVLRHLRAVNALVRVYLNDWVGKRLHPPKWFNLSIYVFSADLKGGDLVLADKK